MNSERFILLDIKMLNKRINKQKGNPFDKYCMLAATVPEETLLKYLVLGEQQPSA